VKAIMEDNVVRDEEDEEDERQEESDGDTRFI